MKVCVIGGRGSVGARYVSILKYLGHTPIVFDVQERFTTVQVYGDVEPTYVTTKLEWHPIPEADKYIIATPTETHYEFCKELMHRNETFLCEKPLARDIQACEDLAREPYPNGFVVNNYAFLPAMTSKPKIRYDYFRTGKDGIYYDCCQLIYLDPQAEINNSSPVWKLTVDGAEQDYRTLEKTYIAMMERFLSGDPNGLWTLQDGHNMTKRVQERISKNISYIHDVLMNNHTGMVGDNP